LYSDVSEFFGVYRKHHQEVFSVAWSPDGGRIASASADRTVQVWEALWTEKVAIGKILLTYQGHAATVSAAVWSPDGERIASASADRTVQVWQAPLGWKIESS
jgi:WD40 repeat protein